jgi:DNA-binding NtrC family response regulator
MTVQSLPTLSRANDLMPSLEDEIRYASQTDACVMLTGESGVGKRAAADMIHQLSHRRRGPFVVVNGADALGTAATAAAQNGTLLIQEVENLTAAAQLQLLRFVDRKTGWRNEVRFMTATSHNLFERVQAGTFDDHLFYRLNMIHFIIRPLRERPDDIPVMFHHYLSQHARRTPRLSSAARRRLVEYPWPGNVTELKTVIQKLGAQELPDVIEPEHLPCPIRE